MLPKLGDLSVPHQRGSILSLIWFQKANPNSIEGLWTAKAIKMW